jgi:hypothetical protein
VHRLVQTTICERHSYERDLKMKAFQERSKLKLSRENSYDEYKALDNDDYDD